MLIAVTVLGTACAPQTESDSSAWIEYQAWTRSAWVVELAGDIAEWNASASGTDKDVLRAAQAIEDDLAPAIEWLDAHPPEPCYAEAYRLNKTWMVEMHASLVGMREAYRARDAEALNREYAVMAGSLGIRQRAGEAHQKVDC